MYMKSENQALRLEKLMQMHQRYPEYELCFPPISVKKSALKKLAVNDVFLLGLAYMEMLLLSKRNGCAKVALSSYDKSMTIKIIEHYKNTERPTNSKKYKNIKILLGTLNSRVLEIGHKIETMQMDAEEVLLYAEEKLIAKGRLVMVDSEIAVEIKEVRKV